MNPFNFALARRHRGFTLIELLIVISILVILSVAVAMNFIGFDYDARHSSTKSNIASLARRSPCIGPGIQSFLSQRPREVVRQRKVESIL